MFRGNISWGVVEDPADHHPLQQLPTSMLPLLWRSHASLHFGALSAQAWAGELAKCHSCSSLLCCPLPSIGSSLDGWVGGWWWRPYYRCGHCNPLDPHKAHLWEDNVRGLCLPFLPVGFLQTPTLRGHCGNQLGASTRWAFSLT